ncbi:MAG: hypothetical protein ABIN67_07245, partial [Ferruginibacter sp.]
YTYTIAVTPQRMRLTPSSKNAPITAFYFGALFWGISSTRINVSGIPFFCDLLIYSISMSYLSSSPTMPCNENFAFLILFLSGFIE